MKFADDVFSCEFILVLSWFRPVHFFLKATLETARLINFETVSRNHPYSVCRKKIGRREYILYIYVAVVG